MESFCMLRKKICYSDYVTLLHHIGEPENKKTSPQRKEEMK